MATISPGAVRSNTMALVLEQIRVLETRLVETLPSDLVAMSGPRYQSLKTGMIDVNRAVHGMFETIRRRDQVRPEELIGAMVTLAAVTAKLASDIGYAAARHKGAIEITVLDDFED